MASTNIFLNPSLISNLNQFKGIPLPINKLIVDQVCSSMITNKSKLNMMQLRQILANQRVEGNDLEKGIKSLKYLLRIAMKNEYSAKAIGLFLVESTLVAKQFAEYLCEKYEDIKDKPIESPNFGQATSVTWGMYNLRQSKAGQVVNKMYMKANITKLADGEASCTAFTMQLPEFKLLLNQVNDIGNNMR